MPSKNSANSLTYVAQKPAFLANFGQPARTSPPPRERDAAASGRGGRGREALPERPRDGQWAQGSDDEREEGSDDEWGERFGGGGDEGPQVVVLKEGRHLSGDEVKRERRRAKGLPSVSPPPASTIVSNKNGATATSSSTSTKPIIPKPHGSSAKRKLVGLGVDEDVAEGKGGKGATDGKDGTGGSGAPADKKKKKKPKKGMLSFNEADGEE